MSTVQEYYNRIITRYTQEELLERVDEQIHDYTPIDGYDEEEWMTDYEWYVDHCNGEAEFDVYLSIIGELGILDLSTEEELALRDLLNSHFNINF